MANQEDSHQASDDEGFVCPVPIKKPRLSFTQDIEVLVGSEKKRFVLHKNHICSRSKYFSAACSERWAKLEVSREFLLPEDDPDIFEIYLNCILQGEVDIGDHTDALDGEETLDQDDQIEVRLVKSYILADKILDAAASNCFIDALIDCYIQNEYWPSPFAVEIVSQSTGSESPLRRLLIDILSREADPDTFHEIGEYEGITRSFIIEILMKKASLGQANQDAAVHEMFDTEFLDRQRKCEYKQHNDSHPKCGDGCVKHDEAKPGDT